MRSFDELLEFLLDEIALKGDRGESIILVSSPSKEIVVQCNPKHRQ